MTTSLFAVHCYFNSAQFIFFVILLNFGLFIFRGLGGVPELRFSINLFKKVRDKMFSRFVKKNMKILNP